MRTVPAIGIAAFVATAVLSSASAGPPAQPFIGFAAAHGRPVAGKWFTGLAVMYIGTPLSGADCHGTIRGKRLVERWQRFYAPQISGPAEITCAWKIPMTAAGKLLVGYTAQGGIEGSGTVLGQTAWRVKR